MTRFLLLHLMLDRDGPRVEGLKLERDEPVARERLHRNAVSKAETVSLTDEGTAQSETLFREMFVIRS